MNVITNGNTLTIIGEEDIEISKKIPVGVYDVCFSKLQGNFLKKRDIANVTEKVYGNHVSKVNKAINAFKKSNRSLGIMLCGDKGIGKTLFVRVLNETALSSGFPTLICTNNTPGLVEFLCNIDQEVVVIFDEFEKNFKDCIDDEDETGASAQEGLLTMFDGLDTTKKMYVITCNNIYKINDYMVDRPGRFHYRFELSNPSPEDITEYMKDNLEPEYHSNIERIINYSLVANVTYDWLRAICFELNCGYSFEETIEDLNISNSEDIDYSVVCSYRGSTYCGSVEIEFGSGRRCSEWMYCGSSRIFISFDTDNIKIEKGSLFIDVNDIRISIDGDTQEDKLESIKLFKDHYTKKSFV